MNINVHIERLIMDGIPIPHRERPLLQAAVEAELARLLTNEGLAPHLLEGGAVPRLQGSNIQLAREGDSGQLGWQIAQSLHIHRGEG
jgi:hypothetical protein